MVMNNPANNNNNNSVAASVSSALALALAPPPHPPQPHRPSTSCDRHPDERFTGFCPSCLFDRLSGLDITTGKSTAVSVASSSRKPPSSSAALKAIFKPSSSSGSLFQELRRTKSFSATKAEALTFEPQRRSCDVRVRNTLWSLFHEEEHNNSQNREGLLSEIDLENANSVLKSPLFEEETEIEIVKDIHEDVQRKCILEPNKSIISNIMEDTQEEKIEKVKDFEMEFNPQTTKKPNRDFKEIAGSFWSAASVFSKKLQKWRQKQKLKKHRAGNLGAGSAALPVEKSIGGQLRDTQSEIAEYGYGRRSCDTDPRFSIDAGRFSIDAGRVSVDDPRYSFDEPRASWDGYMIGRTGAPPRMTSMLSVVEDSPVRNHVLRSDTHIPVEKPPPSPPLLVPGPVMDEIVPGGSAQTREYYLDSSSRRRKSLDRCSSTRKLSASVVAEINEMKLSKESISHSHSHSHSVRDDCSVENTEMGVRENVGTTMECNKKGTKKPRWSWNLFGLLHRKNGNKFEEEEGRSGVDRTFSGSWNVESRKGFDPKMIRSNSSVSWRSSGTNGGGFQRSSVDGCVSGKKKVSKIENGMLKLYLTPSKGRRRGSSNSTTNRPVPASQPFGSRNVMNFY
ncbi:PREDICTED: UPF0503 protein At3g09070, chloroplastic-like [Camelina sativa]|uniref:UPF0503 protein At3g09070, chloroplastic-like n=1 Tax=Camelina sativa TaxID=90675 RepID=A0ABM0ZKP7_CAMSA|nr:PREDICTED: UPF0503 protein At3g09070, chloroplastic-like [Camelina sativa]